MSVGGASGSTSSSGSSSTSGPSGSGSLSGSSDASSPDEASEVGSIGSSVSAAEASSIDADVEATDNATATAVGTEVSTAAEVDTYEACSIEATPAAAMDLAMPSVDPACAPGAPAEDPIADAVVGVAGWTAQTAKGYVTGAVNEVLGVASMVNKPVNAALDAVGIDYQFPTDQQIQPTSTAEENAQRAIGVASLVAGGYSAVKSAPAIARGIDNVGGFIGSMFGAGDEIGDVARTTTNALDDVKGLFSASDELTPNEVNQLRDMVEEIGLDTKVYRAAGFNPDGSINGVAQGHLTNQVGRYVQVGGNPGDLFSYGVPQQATLRDLAPHITGFEIRGLPYSSSATIDANGIMGVMSFDHIPPGVFAPVY
jgi:hypothetical protein